MIIGEVDAECSADLERCITAALHTYPGGLELDLSEVSFFDCAGLNVLLKARTADNPAGHRLTIRTMSARVARVLELTGSQDLLAPRP
ncbi:STAS domain-containing protein [Streptomyces sp. NPDC058691]|uniref:STAS domain-containing protein n=1 Tax=Streptomyces sp. NPDC058691 TaxID=3346601 RepID=UPI003668C495